MWLYWLMFLIPVLLSYLEISKSNLIRSSFSLLNLKPFSFFLLFFYVIIIGFRDQVGADWDAYVNGFDITGNGTILQALSQPDPGYHLIEWLSGSLGLGIYGVNSFAAVVFICGLVGFCRDLPRPWLAFSISIPYLMIVVSMGYTRQGVAIGFILIALVSLHHGRVLVFLFYILIGSVFHKTAIIFLPLALLAGNGHKLIKFFFILFSILLVWFVFLQPSLEYFRAAYIEEEYTSRGAFIRTLINTAPAVAYLFLGGKFGINYLEYRIYKWLSIASIGLFFAYFLSPSSAAIDRIGLYLSPLQLVFFSYLPQLLVIRKHKIITTTAIILLYSMILFLWLNYAIHNSFWIPYKSLIVF